MQQNPWDSLSGVFATASNGFDAAEDIPMEAADNILLAWPEVFRMLDEHINEPSRVLDFGCGGGRLTAELARRGHDAVGLDSSEAMIDAARQMYGDRIHFVHGTSTTAQEIGPFDAIVSVMVMQFIAEADDVIGRLAQRVRPGGVLVFAMHNRDYVRCWIERGKCMVGFDSADTPRVGTLQFDEHTSIPIHVRSAEDYDALASTAGLHRFALALPPFTDDFLDRYPQARERPTEHPEYLILGYRKQP